MFLQGAQLVVKGGMQEIISLLLNGNVIECSHLLIRDARLVAENF